MNTTLTSIPSFDFDPSPVDKVVRRRKLLIFAVGKLNLALPVESVKKILHHTVVHSSGATAVGIAHLDDREITVIDIHRRLFRTHQLKSGEKQQFLILATNSINEQFGILAQETPSLEDVPLSQIRLLPDSFRRADTLEIASHVTVIPRGDNTLTAFVIDVDRLVPPIQAGDFGF